MKAVFILVIFSLFTCVVIYVGYRPVDVGMVQVAIGVLGEKIVHDLRASLPQGLPSWLIYSLPGALWIFSAFTILGLAARRFSKRSKQMILSVVLILPLGMELFQLLHWTDGTYDPVDILFYFIGGAMGAFTLAMLSERTGLRIDWKWVMTFFVLILFFGDQWK